MYHQTTHKFHSEITDPERIYQPNSEFTDQLVFYSILRMNYRVPRVFLQTTLEELQVKITDFTHQKSLFLLAWCEKTLAS